MRYFPTFMFMPQTAVLKLTILLLGCFVLGCSKVEPSFEEMPNICTKHLRGLHVHSDKVIWVSGKGSFWGLSTDGGNSWRSGTIVDEYDLDFRDIQAINEQSAIAMSSGFPATVYRTDDAGNTWKQCFIRKDSAYFLNGIATNGKVFFIYGDPIDGKMLLLKSEDGISWNPVPHEAPTMEISEMGYAASGTGCFVVRDTLHIILGGSKSRLLSAPLNTMKWESQQLPMMTGPGKGPFSFSYASSASAIAVGGSYIDSTNADSNAAVLHPEHALIWSNPPIPPLGYRSCVVHNEDVAICTGRTGTDISLDGGMIWQPLTSIGYFSCEIGSDYAYLVGRAGRFGRVKIYH